jgi:hypothetical protein
MTTEPDPTATDPDLASAPAGRFSTKFPAKTFDSHGQHTGPGPWLDLIGEANRLHPDLFDEPVSVGPWWAGGSVEQYPHARIIHHPDESVSVLALDELGHAVLTQADQRLRTRTEPAPPAEPAEAGPHETGRPQ